MKGPPEGGPFFVRGAATENSGRIDGEKRATAGISECSKERQNRSSE